MKIYTSINLKWENDHYVLDKATHFDYNGEVSLCCGPSKEQKDTYNTQKQLTDTIITQMNAVFGASSKVFNDLVSTFQPIFAAGPNQQGFSPEELATKNSAAVTNVGNQYENARRSIAEQTDSMGGGNIALPSGAAIAPQLALSEGAANETSKELNDINTENYATGRSNWLSAASGLAGAPNVFNPSTSASGVSVNSGAQQGQTADQIAASSNSWVNALIGAGGAIAGGMIAGH